MWITLFAACTEPDPADTAPPADEPAAAALTMPAHGGCTFQSRATELMVEVVSTTVYDAEERVTSDITEAEATGERYAEAWTYGENGCKEAYRREQEYRGELYVVDWIATCDEHGEPVHREGTNLGDAFSTEYTNLYDDDGSLLRMDGAITTLETGATVEFSFAYRWEGEHLAEAALTYAGVPQWQEQTDWVDGVAVEFRYEDLLDASESYTLEYAYDAYGRLESTTRRVGEEEASVTTDVWSNVVHHSLLTSFDGPVDGVLDLQYVWSCTDTFPWSCDAEVDGLTGTGLDGETDAIIAEVWTCGA
jgi:hypothetical protein